MFRRILVPLDRSPLAEQAIGQAAAIARASGAELDLALVHEPFPFDGFEDAPWNSQQWSDEHAYLEALAGEVKSGADIAVTHTVLTGSPPDMIVRRARDAEVDLIVMTSHGRTGLNRAWLGSVADAVVRHSTTPVLLLRPAETKAARLAAHHIFKRILVTLDGSATAQEILGPAAELARNTGAQLMLLRVVQPVPLLIPGTGVPYVYPPAVPDVDLTARVVEDATAHLLAIQARLKADGLQDVVTHVVIDPQVAQAVIDYARERDVDLIAMSTHGRGASRLFVGSVADKVLRASGRPMLVRRPEVVEAAVPFEGAAAASFAF